MTDQNLPRHTATSGPHQRAEPADDEISLWEIFETLQRRWKTVAACATLATLAAGITALLMPKQYEATGLLQIAKVGNLQAALSGSGSLTNPVELPATVVLRLKSDSVEKKVAQKLSTPFDLKAVEPKGTGMIELTMRTTSPQAASQGIEVVVALISNVHEQVFESAEQALQRSMESTKQEAQALNNLIKEMPAVSALSKRDPIVAATVGQTINQMLTRKNELEERRLRLELALSTINSSQTGLVEPATVTDQPVSPKLKLMVVLGLLLGTFAGVLIVFIREAWANHRHNQSLSTSSGTA
jgi:uncharacterized protein involved in exopolysaccharide biosynthesis